MLPTATETSFESEKYFTQQGFAIYERNGVREYWLIDCMDRTMKRFVLDEGRFGQPLIFSDGTPGTSAILSGLVFPAEEVFVES